MICDVVYLGTWSIAALEHYRLTLAEGFKVDRKLKSVGLGARGRLAG
jgi:hypothetical protein